MTQTRLPKKAPNDGVESMTRDLTELLKRIVADCRDPGRFIELYYWSAEPELAEVMRQYIALSDEVRAGLHAFLMLASNDPGSVTCRMTAEGEMILSSPTTAEVARNFAAISERPSVVH